MPKCAAFNKSLTIGPRGTARPCCAFEDTVDLYITDDWRAAHKRLGERSESEWLSNCVECKQAEDNGQRSLRQMFNNFNWHLESGVEYFDFKINNTCNLACRMCDGTSSSTWTSIIKNNPDKNWTTHLKNSARTVTGWHNDVDKVLIELYTAQVVKFTGGEPFLVPQVKDMLEFMIEQDIAYICDLQFITNGTVDISKYYNLLKEFNCVTILVSVDAIGERFEFIRQGASWNQVSENILNIREHANVIVTCLPNVFNKNHIHEVEEWCKENNLTFNQATDLINPEYLRPDATDYTEQMTILDEIHGTDHKKFL